jgi:D-alanyl-D-alanine carboxypeptidase
MATAYRHPGLKDGWRLPVWLCLALCFLPLLVLAGCAQQQYGSYSGQSSQSFAPSQYYPPPGPPDDPWGPYINEAAARYNIPAQWIRAVMAQESGGEEQAVSPVGAMGLMQIMPATYQQLSTENGLGADPFNPHDNILAGAAYISQMYASYGSPGFLAAYNAGPEALDSYLAGTSQLPAETVTYLADVTPNLGTARPLSGPLANYALASAAGTAGQPTNVSFATGCDVNAAYDPDHPCTPETANIIAATEQSAEQSPAGSCDLNAAYDADNPCTPASGAQVAANAGACDLDRAYEPDSPCAPAAPAVQAAALAPVQPAAIQQQVAAGCDPNAAYDPNTPCTPAASPDTGAALASIAAPPASGSLIYQPAAPPSVQPSTPVALTPAITPAVPSGGAWAIQVGAFSSPGLARAVAEGARAELPDSLAAAVIELPATSPFGSLTLYRARLANLSQDAAANACAALSARQLPCIVIPASAA